MRMKGTAIKIYFCHSLWRMRLFQNGIFIEGKYLLLKEQNYGKISHKFHANSPLLSLMWRWSGGAKVLGKLSVQGCPTKLDNSRTRAYCACSRCGWGLFGHFFSCPHFLFSFSLSGRQPDID